MSTIKFEAPIEYTHDFTGGSANTLVTKSYVTTTVIQQVAESGTSGWATNAAHSYTADFASKSSKILNFSIKSTDGNPITTGLKGYLLIPYACTITKWNIRAYPSASLTLDIWKRSQLHPTSNSFSITASAKPAVTSNEYASSNTLTGWTTTALEGDILAFNVDANNNATEIELIIQINM